MEYSIDDFVVECCEVYLREKLRLLSDEQDVEKVITQWLRLSSALQQPRYDERVNSTIQDMFQSEYLNCVCRLTQLKFYVEKYEMDVVELRNSVR
jgi:hypothetical protein